MVTRVKHVEVRRLDQNQRVLNSQSSKKRSDLHISKGKTTRTLTYAERKARQTVLNEQRKKANADLELVRAEIMSMCGTLEIKYGGTKESWYTRVMQTEQIAKGQRANNRWNAFVSVRLGQINAGMFFRWFYFSYFRVVLYSRNFSACSRVLLSRAGSVERHPFSLRCSSLPIY